MKPSDVRILAVDDDQLMLEVVSDLFKAYKFPVDMASSGNKAWELAQRHKYDIVISDVRMPDGGGIELARRLKTLDPKPSILFISGFADLLYEEVYHLGVEGFFAKPFDSLAVKKAIETSLLAPEARWASHYDVQGLLELRKTAPSLSEIETQKDVVFGRGGFFAVHRFAPPPRGTKVAFHFEISGGKPLTFSGVGIVRWVQAFAKNNIPLGLGIEILSMPPGQAVEYLKLFGQVLPFIPSPKQIEIEKKAA